MPIARLLQKEEAVLLVALDDANYLLYENEMNRVLYSLLGSYEAYPGTRIGVIVIISDMDVDLSREAMPVSHRCFGPWRSLSRRMARRKSGRSSQSV